ncbi:hypothetical protein [Aliikangiella sp. IMCC44632]
MKHVVFLVGGYHPKPSAVGNCASKIVECLKGKYKISVISIKNVSDVSENQRMDGYDIYRVEHGYLAKILAKEKSKKYSLHNVTLFFLRALNVLKFLINKKSVDNQLVSSYLSKLVEIEKSANIDVIIPLIFPMETAIASSNFKSNFNNKVTLIPYWFDNFANSASLHRISINRDIKRKRNLDVERKIVANSDLVLAMHPLEDHFKKYLCEAERYKIKYVEHPLLVKIESGIKPIENEIPRLVYAGGLFKGVRDPDYCIRILSALSERIEFEVKFFSFGSGNLLVDSHARKNKNLITSRGRVEQNVLYEVLEHSNILLNIGEVEGKQISSKLFEYISLGKPIVHFAYTKNCVNSKLLERYPLSLIVVQDEGKFEVNLAMLKDFILSSRNKRLTFEDVCLIYPDARPEETAKILIDSIK